MREILFRGKTKQGEWVYGLPFYTNEIIDGIESKDGKLYYVLPETVGQFTGLTDKNGKKVFEGDIVGYTNSDNELAMGGVVKYGYFNCSCCDGVYGWYIEGGDIRLFEEPNDFCEVIGIIHDYPELLEV